MVELPWASALAVFALENSKSVKDTIEGFDIVHMGVDVPELAPIGDKTEVPPMQALKVPMRVVLLKIVAEPVAILWEVAPVDEKTRLPEAPFVAEDASRRNTLVEETEPSTGFIETEEAKPLDDESDTWYPVGAAIDKSLVRLAAVTDTDCATDVVPIHAEKPLTVPVVEILGEVADTILSDTV